jgi:hypothetical protein
VTEIATEPVEGGSMPRDVQHVTGFEAQLGTDRHLHTEALNAR